VLDCDLSCDSSSTDGATADNDVDTTVAQVRATQPTAQTVLGSMGTPITFDGEGHVATTDGVELPQQALTVSMWLRTFDVQHAGMLISFVTETTKTTNAAASTAGTGHYHEFGLYDQRALRVVVQDRVDGTWKVPAQETGVSTNDGEWNHLSVSWNSDNGKVTVHKNGVQVFSTLNYRTGAVLSQRGRIVLGRASLNVDMSSFVPLSGLKGEVQNVRVYRRALNDAGVLDDMSWPFTPRAPVGHLHLMMYWRFSSAYFVGNPSTVANGLRLTNVPITNVVATYVDPSSPLFVNNGGSTVAWNTSDYTGYTSSTGVHIGSSAGSGTGSLSPCVEDAVWYFNAPLSYLKPTAGMSWENPSLEDVYDGRLQFEMKAASFSGVQRPRRGVVELYSSQPPYVIAHVLPDGFYLPTTEEWTAYSVVFREDMGWRTEPEHLAVSHVDMLQMLRSATALRIRGDHWICDANGDGQEATYINHVRIESPQRKRVDGLIPL